MDDESIITFDDMNDPAGDMPPFSVVDRSAIDTSSSVDLGNDADDVPDVCYVLRCKEFGKGLVEVRRSAKPIDLDVEDVLKDKSQKDKKKSVLEIVTTIPTSLVNRSSRIRRRRWRHDGASVDSDSESEVQVVKSENTVMIIRSAHLTNALTAVVSYFPGVSFTGDEVKIEAPYSVLVHHRAALEDYKAAQPEAHDEEYASTTAKHIDILLGFLEQTYGQQIREEEDRHIRKIPTATFDWLWLLLRPGTVVYSLYDSTWAPFAISRVTKKEVSNTDGLHSYSIDCWNYMYFEGKLRRKMHTFEIRPFLGEEAIHNLPVIPARFFTGPERDMSPSAVTAEQVRLGRLAWDLYKKPSYRAYDGDLAKKSPYSNWDYSACPTGYMTGRVIVDVEGYERNRQSRPVKARRSPYDPVFHPRPPQHPPTPFDQLPYFAPHCGCRACGKSKAGDINNLSRFATFQDLDPAHDRAPESSLYYHVVSKVVPGFLLGERRWGHLHVERLCDVKFDKEAFKYLVLDDEIKTTVKALIGKFASAGGHVSAWPSDFVKNKGQGRIFLLHGSPGVGKTCTAECAAELTQRPLLALTSGDLSTDAAQVEQNLEYFLSLGERFGAIVLLDEADVYLESRRDRDIERNGLVSVFLRALEYYRGVLFLTTNRVQAFDAAFTSRIHVALHYGALTDDDRDRIWLNGFERVEREAAARNGQNQGQGRGQGPSRVHVAASAREYAWHGADVRALRWNGREIRNALQTAVALAESDALDDGDDVVVVAEKHLRAVVRMSRGFKNFMRRRAIRGHDHDHGHDEDDDDHDDVYDGHGRGNVIRPYYDSARED